MKNNMKKIRKEKGIKLEDVSKKTGLSIGFLSHLENGKRNPSLKTMRLIAEVLQESITYIFLSNDKEAC